MPWKIVKSGSGYKVKTTATGKAHSKKPMTKAKAKRQLGGIDTTAKSIYPEPNRGMCTACFHVVKLPPPPSCPHCGAKLT